jgi:hypothetical protein
MDLELLASLEQLVSEVEPKNEQIESVLLVYRTKTAGFGLSYLSRCECPACRQNLCLTLMAHALQEAGEAGLDPQELLTVAMSAGRETVPEGSVRH